jgi:predicted TPR repeat methyltransferase
MNTKAGRRDEAIDAYRRALAVDAEHEGAAWSLALAYKNAG